MNFFIIKILILVIKLSSYSMVSLLPEFNDKTVDVTAAQIQHRTIILTYPYKTKPTEKRSFKDNTNLPTSLSVKIVTKQAVVSSLTGAYFKKFKIYS